MHDDLVVFDLIGRASCNQVHELPRKEAKIRSKFSSFELSMPQNCSKFKSIRMANKRSVSVYVHKYVFLKSEFK